MQVLDMTLLYDVVLLDVILCANNIIGMVEFPFVSFTEILKSLNSSFQKTFYVRSRSF